MSKSRGSRHELHTHLDGGYPLPFPMTDAAGFWFGVGALALCVAVVIAAGTWNIWLLLGVPAAPIAWHWLWKLSARRR